MGTARSRESARLARRQGPAMRQSKFGEADIARRLTASARDPYLTSFRRSGRGPRARERRRASMATSPAHDLMANAIRFLAVDAVEKANSGHPGLPMGAADIATVLFRDVLKFDAADPFWPDRDRFVLSAGHGSMLLYALMYLTGVGGKKGLTIDDLKQFRQLGSKTPGPSRIRPYARRRGDHRPARAGAGDLGRHGACGADARRALRRDRRSSHVRARLRRRPDGGR